MDYDVFLDHALPIFGILVLIATVCYLAIRFCDGSRFPDWVFWAIMSIMTFSTGGAILIGWLLPWGSPF